MSYWFRGKKGGLIAFLLIATLVAGGLGWVTLAALNLEQQAELYDKLRLALWRLDSRISPILAREDSRPYSHYSAVFAPSLALKNDGSPWFPGAVLEPSPLLNADLPDWLLLHFQTDQKGEWVSPEVLSKSLVPRLNNPQVNVALLNVKPERQTLLASLSRHLPASTLLARVQERSTQPVLREDMLLPTGNFMVGNFIPEYGLQPNQSAAQQTPVYEFQKRAGQQVILRQAAKGNSQSDDLNVAVANTNKNGESWFAPKDNKDALSQQVSVALGPMTSVWLGTDDGKEQLVVARLVDIGKKRVCQGIVIDWPRLQAVLAGEINDLFPETDFVPVRDAVPPHPERTMTALPVQVEPGPDAAAFASLGWTPLRFGLGLTWAAALLALLAVGLGGWSLLNLSERRIRFVSAVTHELRTPLTTLRLYLDMLASGMVTDEKRKTEYLQTLDCEADRLNRLIGNVLDFSRLENQRPRLQKSSVAVSDFLNQVQATWQGRCRNGDKELVLENNCVGEVMLTTDLQLLHQIVGNLIDNACKYSRGAADRRILVRAACSIPRSSLIIDVADRGLGVPPRDRRSIFRPFRRGRVEHMTVGGVGLGLALALRWAQLLGGTLTLQTSQDTIGACFRVELPLQK